MIFISIWNLRTVFFCFIFFSIEVNDAGRQTGFFLFIKVKIKFSRAFFSRQHSYDRGKNMIIKIL